MATDPTVMNKSKDILNNIFQMKDTRVVWW